jgi:hypothetical protein
MGARAEQEIGAAERIELPAKCSLTEQRLGKTFCHRPVLNGVYTLPARLGDGR